MNIPAAPTTVRELHRLVIGQLATPFVRAVCFALAVASGLFAYGPIFTPNARSYSNPVFGALFRFASPQAWGIGFAIASACLLLAALSARALLYLLGITLNALLLAGWSGLVILEAWQNTDADLTSSALGLYVYAFTATIGLAASPRQLATAPRLELVIDNDTHYELRRTGTDER